MSLRWNHGLSPLAQDDVKSVHFTTTTTDLENSFKITTLKHG